MNVSSEYMKEWMVMSISLKAVQIVDRAVTLQYLFSDSSTSLFKKISIFESQNKVHKVGIVLAFEI